jgi:hypothetical protein
MNNEVSYLYTIGPMRGLPDWNYLAFEAAEKLWTGRGWHVFNPAKLGRAAGFTVEATDGNCGKHLRAVIMQDIGLIFISDAVAVLEGWEYSMGSAVEVSLAQFLGLPI